MDGLYFLFKFIGSKKDIEINAFESAPPTNFE